LYQYLITNTILVNKQFGFRTKSSTVKATFNLIGEILDALNNKKMAGGIFCDLEKACDCVNHDISLSKLEFHGRRDKSNDLIVILKIGIRVLIESMDSYQSLFSNWGKVKHSVPQGSILGQLLFLFYINNSPKIIKIYSEAVLFADDTSLITVGPSPIDFKKDITTAFVQLSEWFNANSLFLNYEKNTLRTFHDQK
jgi:hypothetical protein